MPIGKLGNRYEPLAAVPVVCGVINAGLVSVTVAPGRTAPVPSVTLPKISPVWVWATALVADSTNTKAATSGPRDEPSMYPPQLMQNKINAPYEVQAAEAVTCN